MRNFLISPSVCRQACLILRNNMATASATVNSASAHTRPAAMTASQVFKPKRVLVLTKMTRYDVEKRRFDGKDDAVFEKEMTRRGSDPAKLKHRHQVHQDYLDKIVSVVCSAGIEVRVVQRLDFTSDSVHWADAILTAGGDGTFLLGASKVLDSSKPVIGINTDPGSSEGYMCLMRKLPVEHFQSAFDRLLNGNFEWLYRQRIRVTLFGKDAWQDPIELSKQQLLHPEFRWVEHLKEHEEPSDANAVKAATEAQVLERRLPFLALNEVYIGESLSSRLSYYELSIDGDKALKQKSSGLTVCTGTGSTSWYFNINKMTTQSVSELVGIIEKEVSGAFLLCFTCYVNQLF